MSPRGDRGREKARVVEDPVGGGLGQTPAVGSAGVARMSEGKTALVRNRVIVGVLGLGEEEDVGAKIFQGS